MIGERSGFVYCRNICVQAIIRMNRFLDTAGQAAPAVSKKTWLSKHKLDRLGHKLEDMGVSLEFLLSLDDEDLR